MDILIKLILYMIRWQCSTPILAIVTVNYLAWRRKTKPQWPIKDEWIAAVLANIIGSLIFFGVDMLIFN